MMTPSMPSVQPYILVLIIITIVSVITKKCFQDVHLLSPSKPVHYFKLLSKIMLFIQKRLSRHLYVEKFSQTFRYSIRKWKTTGQQRKFSGNLCINKHLIPFIFYTYLEFERNFFFFFSYSISSLLCLKCSS